jgi:hypothetical protein
MVDASPSTMGPFLVAGFVQYYSANSLGFKTVDSVDFTDKNCQTSLCNDG